MANQQDIEETYNFVDEVSSPTTSRKMRALAEWNEL
jgi:hypothetical protein